MARFTTVSHEFSPDVQHNEYMTMLQLLTGTATKRAPSLKQRLVSVVEAATSPLSPADYLDLVNPLRSGAELRGRVLAVRPETADSASLDILPGNHPIAPIMYGDAVLAGKTAEAMLERGVYVIAFSFPVVPRGQARIRTQMSAAHSTADIDRAIDAFVEVRTAIAGD